jgi:hypothetical protein
MDDYRNEQIIYDLCVVGSGPAGIITAMEYAKCNSDKNVLLIEYGTKEQINKKNKLDETIVNNNFKNHHNPYDCNNKEFGGSSASWGGRCVMYDEIDFLQRDIIGQDCTWDLEMLNDINSFLLKSAAYFECGQPIFNLNELPEVKQSRIAEGFIEGIVLDSVIERWSMPTRFGSRYKSEIEKLKNITVLEGYCLNTFSTPDTSGLVTEATIENLKTREKIVIKAANFVVASGAQESTRILLKNEHLFSNLNEVPKSLGHYYQGHLSGKIASVKFNGNPSKTDYGFLRDIDGTYIRRRFQFTTAFLKEQNLLNTAIWLDNPLYHDPKHKSGPMSFMYLAMITPILGKKLAPPAIAESITKGKVVAVHKHLWNIIKGFPNSIIIPATIFYKRFLLKRKLPGVFLYSPNNTYALHFHAEQLPVFESRMSLDITGDNLVIDYSIAPEDINSVIKLHKALDTWLQECGCGQLEYWFPEEELYNAIQNMSKDGIHQLGTTRIANSPDNGVVDTNLKVFGTSNVFICSSSTFPTSGQANPTYLLGAFAARLAKHLTEKNEKN